ncbi:MAG: alpha/beta hydrolase [Candidatus Obscuribacter sp.]|nr:alpha/beta hydrolase [Candidatus Obscuribacter sp.]
MEKPLLPHWYMRAVRLSAFALVCLYVGLSPYVLFQRFEFFPVKVTAYKVPVAICDLTREEVSFEAGNGCKLRGWYLPRAKAKYTVILHHGQGANIAFDGYAETAAVLVKAGASVLLYDFEGFGRSDGSPSNQALSRDALAAYKFLCSRGVKGESIVHFGLSLGTGAASQVASSKPCAGLILVSPYMSLSRVAAHHLPYLKFYPDWLYPQPNLGGQCLNSFKQPVMIFHAAGDRLLPVGQADELAHKLLKQGCRVEYFRIEQDGHLGALSGAHSDTAGGVVDICRRFLKHLENPTSEPSLTSLPCGK